MKKTTDSSTLHNSFVSSSQENLQENNTGANSMPTQAPTEWHKSVIVQSSPDEFSASQVELRKTQNEFEFSTKDICNDKSYYDEFNLHYQNQSHSVVLFFWLDILGQIDCKHKYSSVY